MKKFLLLLFFVPLITFGQTTIFEKGIASYKNENYKEAAIHFKKVGDENSNYYKAQEYLGDIAGQQEKWDVALEYYGNLVESFPKNANYNFKYGGALGLKALELSRVEALFYISDIKKHLKLAAVLDPEHIEVRYALIKLYLDLPVILGGSTEKAYTYANQLSAVSEVDGWLAKGKIALHNDNYKTSEKYYKNAVAVGQSVTTYKKLLHLYRVSKQLEKAKEIETIAAKKFPKVNWANI